MIKKLPKRGLPPMHPGELLRDEILPALGRPKTEIAKLLGVSRQTLYDILEERQPVTPAMALRLGKLCGNGPDLWLNLQKRYDLQRAEQELGEKIKAIPTLEVGMMLRAKRLQRSCVYRNPCVYRKLKPGHSGDGVRRG
jgi:antitoxin HigA-1